ncbi:hypothetical protein FRB97_009325 [Tulasnella sp. 331]|nr:hypothetical protein FRB97_009325 [Tulasnella sp. 331]
MATARTLLALGLTALFTTSSSVEASAAHERYNPYAYLTLTTTGSLGTATDTATLIPVPVSTSVLPVTSNPSSSIPISTSILTSLLPTSIQPSTKPTSTTAPIKRSVSLTTPGTASASTASSTIAVTSGIASGIIPSATVSSGISSWVIPSATVTPSSTPTPTSTSSIDVVAIDPPTETSLPPYMANTFFASWHAMSPNSSGFDSSSGSASGTIGGAPGESGRTFGLDDLQWDLLYSVTYGFIPIPISNFGNITLSLQDASLLPQFVTMAKAKNVIPIISFGGWISSPSTGGSSSSGFPLALATSETITDFVNGVTDLVNHLGGVGGVEFDWEYTDCSTDTPYTDMALSTAYLTFLQQLRASLSPNVTISLAVGVVPFETPQIVSATVNGTTSNNTIPVDTPINANDLIGAPVGTDGSFATVATTLTGEYKNVSAFASVVDYITVMNFDLYGPWSTTPPIVMPNSPLNGTCASATPTMPTLPGTSTSSIGVTPTAPFSILTATAITASASAVASSSFTTTLTSFFSAVVPKSSAGPSTSSAIIDAHVNLDTGSSFNDTTSVNSTTPWSNATVPASPEEGSNSTTVSAPLPVYATTAIASWIMSGFRADQIVLGVSSSGRSYRVPTASAISPTDDDALIAYPTFSTDSSTLTTGLNVTAPNVTSLSVAAPSATSLSVTSFSAAALNVTATNATSPNVTAINGTTAADSSDLGDVWWWGDLSVSTTAATTNSTGNDTATSTGTATCALPSTLSTISGVFTFNGLLDAGFLDSDGLPADCGPEGVGSGFVGGWDICSQTPFVYNTKTQVYVSYDDAESMEIKGAFVLASGLRGFSLYEAGGDSANATLLTALRLGAGFPSLSVLSNSTMNAITNSTANSTSSSPTSEYDWSFAHNSTVVPTGTNSTSTEIGAVDWQELLQSAVDGLEVTLDGSDGTGTGVSTSSICTTATWPTTSIPVSTSTVVTASTPSSTNTAGGSANPFIPLAR